MRSTRVVPCLVALVFTLALAAALLGCDAGRGGAEARSGVGAAGAAVEALEQRLPAQTASTLEGALSFVAKSEALLTDPGWSSTGLMAHARAAHTATLLLDGRVLVAGGYDAGAVNLAEVYDPKTGVWSKTAGELTSSRDRHTATLLPNGKVLVAGGEDENHNVLATAELYDPATGMWSATGKMMDARWYHTATLLPNGKVMVAGGSDGAALSTAELYDPTTGTWSKLMDMSFARAYHTATLLPNGKVLVTGGASNDQAVSTAEIYDPSANMWTQPLDLMISPRARHTATLLPNGKVLLAGGEGLGGWVLDIAELYDPVADTWTQTLGYMTSERFDHTATLLPDGKVLLAGGGGNIKVLSTAELYDPVTQMWSKTAGEMSSARGNAAATLLQSSKVLLTGGINAELLALPTAETYDPSFSVWQPAASTTSARAVHTATLLQDGSILVAGGQDLGANVYAVSKSELYDPVAKTWKSTKDMLSKRVFHTATLLQSGKVLVAGGRDSGVNPVYKHEVYDPFAMAWTKGVALMHSARFLHTATLLQNGKVLVAGGSGDTTAELYDPGADAWTKIMQPMISSRGRHTATLLPDGRVLVAGGKYDIEYQSLSTAELYDPGAGTWTRTTGDMTSARANHTATLLPNGKVLVAGGSDGSALSTAELYDPAADTWTLTGSMSTARAFHTATLLDPDDRGTQRVLVTGGVLGSALPSVEAYDPTTGEWQVVSPMRGARSNHTATKLGDGSVIVTSGFDGNNALMSAERYLRTPNGALCLFAGDCLSEFCTDGVCCDTACEHDGCHACSFAAGALKDGECHTVDDGALCTDNDACTAFDTCQAGKCVGAGATICPGPADECHLAERCNKDTAQCEPVEVADGMTCTDKCATAAVCMSGTCASVLPVECPAPDACHLQGTCDPATGACSTPPAADDTPCDDGNGCTESDACQAGLCVGGSLKVCPTHLRCDLSKGDCLTSCASVTDCVDGFVCDLLHQCVPQPPNQSQLDDAGCSVAPPVASEAARAFAALGLLLAAALAPLRRRRRIRA